MSRFQEVCGGHYLTRELSRQPWMSAELLPPRLWSVSSCLAGLLPDLWGIRWTGVTQEQRRLEARSFGISESALPGLLDWTTNAFAAGRFGWPNNFADLAAAREFARAFVPELAAVHVVGIGLPADLRERALAALDPGGDGPSGLYTNLQRGALLEAQAEPLGFEVLGTDQGGAFHSWLCHGLEVEMHERFGCRPNEHGLLDDLAVARRVAEAVGREGLGEPGCWLPWLLVRYPAAAGPA